MSEIQTLEPIWKDNFSAIAMSSSNEYLPYLSVCLQSLIDHTSADHNYDVIIFSSSDNILDKKLILETYCRKNVSVRFYNPKQILADIKLTVTHSYFNEACYYRIVCPRVTPHYKKIIFTDLDLIFNKDIRHLYEFELGDSPLAACLEPIWKIFVEKNLNIKNFLVRDYATKVLRLKVPTRYYNTGVMLLNIEQFCKNNYFDQIKDLINSHTFLYQEQDAFNMLLQDTIKPLPASWNNEMSPRLFPVYSQKKPDDMYVIHWLGGEKPWHFVGLPYAYMWWQYARRTPFYERILNSCFARQLNELKNSHQAQVKALLNYRSNVKKYWEMRLLSNITWGKRKAHYMQQKHFFKQQIDLYKSTK